MKHLSSLLLMATLAFTALPSVAQPPPPAPAPPAVALLTGNAPMGPAYQIGPMYVSSTRLYKYSRYAYVYSAADLATAGLTVGRFIDTLGFFKSGLNSFNYAPWTHTVNIYITEQVDPTFSGNSTFTAMTAGLSPVTTIIDPVVPSDSGIVKFPISMPYEYQGGNLRVVVDYAATGGTGNTQATGQIDWRRWSVPSSIMGNANTSATDAMSTSSVNISVSNMRPETYIYHAATVSTRNALARQFRMFPNPATNVLNISNNVGAELQTATLTDLSGRQVLTQPVSGLTAQLDLSQVTPGMYHLHLTTSRGPAILTVVKQ